MQQKQPTNWRDSYGQGRSGKISRYASGGAAAYRERPGEGLGQDLDPGTGPGDVEPPPEAIPIGPSNADKLQRNEWLAVFYRDIVNWLKNTNSIRVLSQDSEGNWRWHGWIGDPQPSNTIARRQLSQVGGSAIAAEGNTSAHTHLVIGSWDQILQWFPQWLRDSGLWVNPASDELAPAGMGWTRMWEDFSQYSKGVTTPPPQSLQAIITAMLLLTQQFDTQIYQLQGSARSQAWATAVSSMVTLLKQDLELLNAEVWIAAVRKAVRDHYSLAKQTTNRHLQMFNEANLPFFTDVESDGGKGIERLTDGTSRVSYRTRFLKSGAPEGVHFLLYKDLLVPTSGVELDIDSVLLLTGGSRWVVPGQQQDPNWSGDYETHAAAWYAVAGGGFILRNPQHPQSAQMRQQLFSTAWGQYPNRMAYFREKLEAMNWELVQYLRGGRQVRSWLNVAAEMDLVTTQMAIMNQTVLPKLNEVLNRPDSFLGLDNAKRIMKAYWNKLARNAIHPIGGYLSTQFAGDHPQQYLTITATGAISVTYQSFAAAVEGFLQSAALALNIQPVPDEPPVFQPAAPDANGVAPAHQLARKKAKQPWQKAMNWFVFIALLFTVAAAGPGLTRTAGSIRDNFFRKSPPTDEPVKWW